MLWARWPWRPHQHVVAKRVVNPPGSETRAWPTLQADWEAATAEEATAAPVEVRAGQAGELAAERAAAARAEAEVRGGPGVAVKVAEARAAMRGAAVMEAVGKAAEATARRRQAPL